MASSSVCNFLGVVTTKAAAGSTSVTKREKDKRTEVEKISSDSQIEAKGFEGMVSFGAFVAEIWEFFLRREKMGNRRWQVGLEKL